MELCQLDSFYLYNLNHYNRIVNQRNKLLKDMYMNPDLKETLGVWDMQLASFGSKIIQRRKLFGFTPDPDMPFYAFNPESRMTMLARMTATKEGIAEFGFVPCYINQAGAPEALTTYEEARKIMDYVGQISREQKLQIRLTWEAD